MPEAANGHVQLRIMGGDENSVSDITLAGFNFSRLGHSLILEGGY